MSYFKLAEIIENWDSIVLEVDARPKEKSTRPDDYDELTERFLNSIFGEEESEEEDQIEDL